MEDIIVALATAWGESGISIVRISGVGCVKLADRLFRGRRSIAEQQPRYLSLGKLCETSGVIFDEILAVRFEKDASYTGEESVELHCHGGNLPAQRCIEQLCSLGARIALPGEFTRRAFINGRMDLSQAEAVLGLIKAESDEALYASTRTLQGGFANQIKNFLAEITVLAAKLEVDLDFPESEEGLLPKKHAVEQIEQLVSDGESLLLDCRTGLILREGARVAIVGRPNVGKSSLLNALLKEQRAIVTSVPGTTRDRIEETIIHKGVPLRVIDTAGIRETSDEVELIGVTHSIRSMEEADLRVWVVDAGEPLTEEDICLGYRVSAMRHIIVLNKNDIQQITTIEELRDKFTDSCVFSVSALKSDGIDELKNLIVTLLTGNQSLSGSYGVTSRQVECLSSAISSVKEAKQVIIAGLGDDLAITCIYDARSQLSSLLGLDATEDLLDVVFGSFCVGK